MFRFFLVVYGWLSARIVGRPEAQTEVLSVSEVPVAMPNDIRVCVTKGHTVAF
jgi:hypothetical protein